MFYDEDGWRLAEVVLCDGNKNLEGGVLQIWVTAVSRRVRKAALLFARQYEPLSILEIYIPSHKPRAKESAFFLYRYRRFEP